MRTGDLLLPGLGDAVERVAVELEADKVLVLSAALASFVAKVKPTWAPLGFYDGS